MKPDEHYRQANRERPNENEQEGKDRVAMRTLTNWYVPRSGGQFYRHVG